MENYYVLKKGDFYLSEISFEDGKELTSFVMDKEYKHIYADFELAEEDRKVIFIETGLDLIIKKLKEVEK